MSTEHLDSFNLILQGKVGIFYPDPKLRNLPAA